MAPPPPTQPGLLYAQWTLDCVITIARRVAEESVCYPAYYGGVDDPTATNLTDFDGNYGFRADRPDCKKRIVMMQNIYGGSDGHCNGSCNDGSAFQMCRWPIFDAACRFVETTQTTGFDALRNTFKRALDCFLTHMRRLQGGLLTATENRIGSEFTIAQEILQSTAVRFGITQSIDSNWPLEPAPRDANGAELIERITTLLPDQPCGVISRECFVHIQEIADTGSQSISRTLDSTVDALPPDQLDQLIALWYRWGFDLCGCKPPQPKPAGMPPPVQTGMPPPVPASMPPRVLMGTAPSVAQLRVQAAAPAPALPRAMTVYSR
jgi:hypothetical protein